MSVFVFSQNLKLDSLKVYSSLGESQNEVITTHFLFENERELLNSIFTNCTFHTFADYLTDSEMAEIDEKSYKSSTIAYEKYLSNIKEKKNRLVAEKALKDSKSSKLYIFSDDLGIDIDVWANAGFKYVKCEYYYHEKKSWKTILKNYIKAIPGLKKIKDILKPYKMMHDPSEVLVANYNGRKYVFLGKINRIGYRLNLDFKPSEVECAKINKNQFESKDTCTYFTTWHEHGKCNVPDNPKYEVRWAQDGYLPPNYSHKDYFFKPDNVKYYCWDVLGMNLFKNQGLPYEMIPFRKKLYIPTPVFSKKVMNILIVASGSGDWTALKNRSDDDIMVDAFVQMARRFPEIHFTYRCHPTWVHPQNVGVNAINRVHNYFRWLNLPNLTLSSNTPPLDDGNGFQYSFSRSSLDEDLKSADLVFGEHSVSMIDAAFKGIPFASVNITNRRNFFIGINNLGFPTCRSHEDIAKIIENATEKEYQEGYLKAVENYNRMTDEERSAE